MLLGGLLSHYRTHISTSKRTPLLCRHVCQSTRDVTKRENTPDPTTCGAEPTQLRRVQWAPWLRKCAGYVLMQSGRERKAQPVITLPG